MALKDWKKTRNKYNSIEWNKLGKRIWIIKAMNYQYWEVYINFDEPTQFKKEFKTKSQALRFAKQYMRKH